MWDRLKFTYEVPIWTKPNQIALNRTMRTEPKQGLHMNVLNSQSLTTN